MDASRALLRKVWSKEGRGESPGEKKGLNCKVKCGRIKGRVCTERSLSGCLTDCFWILRNILGTL